MLKIVGCVNHRVGATINIHGAHGPWTRSYLRDRFGWQISAEEMILALHVCFKVERFAIVRPFQTARNKIETVSGERRRRATSRRGKPDLWMIAIVNLARISDRLTVR